MARKIEEVVLAADAAVADAVKPHAAHPLVRAISVTSEIGDQPQMRLLCASVVAAGILRRDGKMVRTGFAMLAAHTLATLAKDVVKERVDRTRPHAKHKKGKDHRVSRGGATSKEETSFPSGHTAGAIAVARAFAREYPEHAAAAYGAAGFVALAQIPRCAHYPSDVGAGLAIGLAAELATDAVLRHPDEKGRLA